ncbi:unnamed protein product [Effrenium voratum]|nr:unnamed protein product [Effrenium voratum]
MAMFFLPRLIIDSCPFHVFLPGVDAQPGSRTTATGALTSMSWQSERAAANPPVSFHTRLSVRLLPWTPPAGAMGAACHCAGSDKEETFRATPRVASDVVSVLPDGGPVPPEFQKLQGKWRTEADKAPMGEIIGATIVWDKMFNLEQSLLKLTAEGEIEMRLNDAVHKAKCDSSGSRLVWSDGEVWVRK